MKLAVLPFLKRSSQVVEIPVNFTSKKSTKTLTTGSGSYERHLSLLPWTKWKSIKLLKSWTMLNAQWSTLVSVELRGDVIDQIPKIGKTSATIHAHISYRVGAGNQPTKWSLKQTLPLPGSTLHLLEVYEAFKNTEKFIRGGYRPYKLGKRHALDASILEVKQRKQLLTKWIQLNLPMVA